MFLIYVIAQKWLNVKCTIKDTTHNELNIKMMKMLIHILHIQRAYLTVRKVNIKRNSVGTIT